MRVSTSGLLPLLVVGLLVAGCAETPGEEADPGRATPATGATPDGAPAGPAAGPDPCGLLTGDEVADAVGAEVTGTDGPTEEHMAQACYWYFPDQVLTGEDGEATVHVWVGEEFYTPDADPASAGNFDPVSGIGDKAHMWPPVEGICTVIFMRGEHVVQVSTLGAGGESCVGLAGSAADRV